MTVHGAVLATADYVFNQTVTPEIKVLRMLDL